MSHNIFVFRKLLFINIVVIVFDDFNFASFIKDKWPSCKLPIVGIKANLPGLFDKIFRVSFSSALVRAIIINIMAYVLY